MSQICKKCGNVADDGQEYCPNCYAELGALQKGSKNAGEKRLALNFLSDALHLRNAAVELLHRFPGNTEVLFRDAATGKVLLAPRHCCVNCAEELLFELKRMLGEENVKIVRKK